MVGNCVGLWTIDGPLDEVRVQWDLRTRSVVPIGLETTEIRVRTRIDTVVGQAAAAARDAFRPKRASNPRAGAAQVEADDAVHDDDLDLDRDDDRDDDGDDDGDDAGPAAAAAAAASAETPSDRVCDDTADADDDGADRDDAPPSDLAVLEDI